MTDGALQRAHRPQLARSALQQRVVHRKRQARLALPAARRYSTTRAQRVVEVGRVHLRALVRRACAQPRQRVDRTTPRLHQRAVAGTVLQANHMKAVIQHSDVDGARMCAQRCEIDALHIAGIGSRSGATHRHGINGVGLAAAHLEAAI